MTFIRSRQG